MGASDSRVHARIREVSDENAQGAVSRRPGTVYSMVGIGRAERALLSEAPRSGAAANWYRADVANYFLVALVWPLRPGGGRSAVRHEDDARVCRNGYGKCVPPNPT